MALDIECFSNWFLVGLTDLATQTHWDFELWQGGTLDVAGITAICKGATLVTFNGQNYDVPMLSLALAGADCGLLKAANDSIIVGGLKWWQFARRWQCWPPEWLDHIDVSEPTPGVKISLKQYACRMHSKRVQDSPVDFSLPIAPAKTPSEIEYCRNDRLVTGELFRAIKERIELRKDASARYGVDLRSKSDAQMAEAMVKAEWTRRTGQTPIIPKYPHGTSFKAKIPWYISFATAPMRQLLGVVENCDFVVSDKEEAVALGYDGKNIRTGVQIPQALKGRDIVIGQTVYRVGIGGLHSQESNVSYRSVPGQCTLRTADVRSYYPSLIINAGMNPSQLGPEFLNIYSEVYRERLAAKADPTMKTKEAGFKIILNGTFGKLFSRFSIFYAPELGIAVTIGGQLSLLMLIERLELSGIRVVSANTDGVEMLIPWGYEKIADQVIAWWEATTGLGMDSSAYLSLHARDVNNYIALYFNGTVKRKGVFGESGVLKNKHPDLDICADAVVAWLTKGIPIETTIRTCQDIRKFIRVRGAKGGARVGDGPNLGRAVRWYYAKNCTDFIADAASGNKVAGSDGARVVMELPDTLPSDIDYDHYIDIARKML